MRARGRCCHGRNSTNVVSPQYALLAKGTFGKSKMADVDMFGSVAFVIILLNRPHRSHRFIYFKALFSCKIHQGKIYKTQRVLVANLVTNFWILVAITIILVALATVLGAILCPAINIRLLNFFNYLIVFDHRTMETNYLSD